MSVEIRRGGARFVDREPGRLTRHGFSFGAHYDPEWVAFGPMVCHDDHLLGSGRGFDDHPHEGVAIVTWVVSGSVTHQDSLGTEATLGAGECGVLVAGTGIRHAEHATGAGPARFVQVWLRLDDTIAPSYARGSVAAGGGMVPVAGAGTLLELGVPGASYSVARLAAGEQLSLPVAPRVHAYVASGALLRSSLAEPLSEGDAFCMTDERSHTVTAAVPTDLLVWTF